MHDSSKSGSPMKVGEVRTERLLTMDDLDGKERSKFTDGLDDSGIVLRSSVNTIKSGIVATNDNPFSDSN